MKKNLLTIAPFALLFGLGLSSGGNAGVIQTTGAGSAVSTVDAKATFENPNSLTANPYVEDGISFSRTGLSSNNNGCGFAGPCGGAFPYFEGNYMYGAGARGFFSISDTTANPFTGLEFISGSGFGPSSPENFSWEAYLDEVLTGKGSGTVQPGTVLGFADAAGFDTLRWTVASGDNNAPAFDTVKVQYLSTVPPNPVPEPTTLALLSLSLLAIGIAHKRKQ